jgi:4-amino-4-deoxy-L-arabinose transferase-like glycosyltransferase
MKITKQKLLTFFLLLGILLIALFARTYNLSSVPSGFHIDEAIIADNAYSIMKTGKDTDNHFLPLQTEVFGDYNPTGYAYLAILPIRLFGLTIAAARSVGAVLGVFAVLAVFFLTYSIFERTDLSLLSSLLVALSPWDIVLSRSTEETAASLVFIVFGFACLSLEY